MQNLPQPKPARLGPPGLYVLPEAVGFPGPVIVQDRLPVRLHFVLEDGTEFHLPTTETVLGRLYTALKVHFGNDADEV